MDEYKKIVRTISPLVGDAGVSIEVFSDEKTTAQEMFSQGQVMFSWIPNAYIKYRCTAEGVRAAQNSVKQGMRVNMTLCFSQQQAAVVYAATKGTKEPAYVSPFVGRNGACQGDREILERGASKTFPTPDNQFQCKASGKPIPYNTRSLAWSKGGKRLKLNTSLRAKASRNSLLTIEPRFRDCMIKVEH
jgi:hypothetical protein